MEELERAHTDDTQIIRGGKIYDKKKESTFEDNLMLLSRFMVSDPSFKNSSFIIYYNFRRMMTKSTTHPKRKICVDT